MLDNLPVEILHQIFSELPPSDLLQTACLNARQLGIITGSRSPVRNRLPPIKFKLQIKEYKGVKGYSRSHLKGFHDAFYFVCYEIVVTGHKKNETAQPSASLYIYMPCCSNDKQHKEVLGADENRTDRNSHPHVGFNEMFNDFFSRRNYEISTTFESIEEVKCYMKQLLTYLNVTAHISKVTLSEVTADTWMFLEKIFLDLNIGRHCPVECHVTDGQNAEDDLMDVIECTKVPISYFYITSIYCFPGNWFYSDGLQNAHIHFISYGDMTRLIVTFRSLCQLLTGLYETDRKVTKWEICSNLVGFPRHNFLSHMLQEIKTVDPSSITLTDCYEDVDEVEETAIIHTATQDLLVTFYTEKRLPTAFKLTVEVVK